MILKYTSRPPANASHILIPLAQSDRLNDHLAQIANNYELDARLLQQDFTAEAKTVCQFYPSNSKGKRVFLLGLGKAPGFQHMLQAFKSFAFHHKSHLSSRLSVIHTYIDDLNEGLYAKAVTNGLLLGTYQTGLYKTSEADKHALLGRNAQIQLAGAGTAKMKKGAEEGVATAFTQMQIFDLVNGPGNKIRPDSLAKWAKASGKKNGFKVKVLNKSQIQKTGLHALIAVNRGSEWPPAFIIMEYKGKANKKSKKAMPRIGLVGKGVTFDTGGLSIKGSNNMHFMKSDMGGAAAVLGTMELCAKLDLPVHLIGIVPTTDNCVDATAIKPGDIIDSYSGKTIEVIDTDAEGRLILADGLAYINKNFKPEVIIDLATLTGSCVRALGYQAAGLFTKNDELASQLLTAGQYSGERVWRLPMWDDYKKDIESDVADLRNFSGRPIAGAISAAKFLEAFTNEHPKWAHLDIAGVAFGQNIYSKQKSATAYGIELLTEFIKSSC